jgi:hypothetical protein
MFGFGKKIEMRVPDGNGGEKTVFVSKRKFNEWMKNGDIAHLQKCKCHVLNFTYQVVEWTIKKDISREQYEQYKDDVGDLYAVIYMEDGENVTTLMEKSMWMYVKKQMGI